MPDVKQRMLDIVDSVPEDYFDGLKPTEMVFKLMFEYIDRYGEDETTIIPGTNKHLNRVLLLLYWYFPFPLKVVEPYFLTI